MNMYFLKVEELRDILYDMPWYFCDKVFLRIFKVVQLRMTRNDYLKAGGVLPISLETWLEVIITYNYHFPTRK